MGPSTFLSSSLCVPLALQKVSRRTIFVVPHFLRHFFLEKKSACTHVCSCINYLIYTAVNYVHIKRGALFAVDCAAVKCIGLTIKFPSMQEVRRPDPDLPGGGRLHESGGGRGVRFRLGEGDLRAAGRSAARILAHTGK